MEAQERHSPEPILEETFLPQPSDLQLGSHHPTHHPHLDPDDTSSSSLLHELTSEQADLLKVQLQLHSYQQQRLHLHQHLHHHQHPHPFSLDDDEDDEEHNRSPLEHHHHHEDVLRIHPNDTGISTQDLAPTSGLHHLDFGHPVEFADGQGLQIHSHQPIYEDPTGGPYHLSQPFDLSSSSLSFGHADLTDNVHSHHSHQLYPPHPDHHLSVQPVASSSTSSIEDTQPSGPIKKKIGRPGRKKSGAISVDHVSNVSSEETSMGTAIGHVMGASAKIIKPTGGSTTGPGPTKRLRTVASLGDDMEKIEKLRAQGRERQRRKRERDRARAAGLSVEPENTAPKSISGQNFELDRDLESSLTMSLYHPVQSAPHSSPPSDSTTASLLATSQNNQPTLESGLPPIDPPPIFRLHDHDDRRQTTNGQPSTHLHIPQPSHPDPSPLSADLDPCTHAPAQAHPNKILDDQGMLQGLDDLSRSGIRVLEEHMSAGNNRGELVDIQQCLERVHTQRNKVEEPNKDEEHTIQSMAPAQVADALGGGIRLSVGSDLALTDGKALDRVVPIEKVDEERKDRCQEDGRSAQSPKIDSALTLDEWDISIDLGLDRHLSSSPSRSDESLNGNIHPQSDGSGNQNGNGNEDSTRVYHASLRVKGTTILGGQDGLHVEGLHAQDGDHPEGLLEMTPSSSIPLLPYFCSG
ncbi:hypothetical protein [Phaffia rhodozyma]|uniref:Uncharacterized protein n=1 Tax=Phaffia rhodozyma TaxID=264483 RepID=A0A0F7SJZ2_PHARH|nr:hypothetical protein [Phaffia rhodozyma]